MKLKTPHKIIIGIGSFLLVYGATFAAFKVMEKTKGVEVNVNALSGEITEHKTYTETADGSYIGDIIDGIFEGKGQFNFLSGEIYAGDWLESKMDGEGKMIFNGVGVYDGEYTDSKRGGYGTFTTTDTYQGSVFDTVNLSR